MYISRKNHLKSTVDAYDDFLDQFQSFLEIEILFTETIKLHHLGIINDQSTNTYNPSTNMYNQSTNMYDPSVVTGRWIKDTT